MTSFPIDSTLSLVTGFLLTACKAAPVVVRDLERTHTITLKEHNIYTRDASANNQETSNASSGISSLSTSGLVIAGAAVIAIGTVLAFVAIRSRAKSNDADVKEEDKTMPPLSPMEYVYEGKGKGRMPEQKTTAEVLPFSPFGRFDSMQIEMQDLYGSEIDICDIPNPEHGSSREFNKIEVDYSQPCSSRV
ncbi:hypothetical protein BASA50_002199 [Batrachochytrium salamandrivorans]|uniref:Uncharacterized protein n=1 Tax=Batrachochytrium salamandrivorans TaxID=1357716 RepID=A0ABQ8FM52_9FUNG|nr:hypothetical protein BASA50_002199 [Batrachochytrium salamandrivorans]KAH9272246.1 hypothetical protein BASA83_005589 [Batrachochytrium salamandrivorans]